MDQWQKEVYDKLKDIVDREGPHQVGVDPVRISITVSEAYVLMKALEAQQALYIAIDGLVWQPLRGIDEGIKRPVPVNARPGRSIEDTV